MAENTHWEITQKRKRPDVVAQYLLATSYFKILGAPVGRQPGESWNDYVLRTTPPERICYIDGVPYIC